MKIRTKLYVLILIPLLAVVFQGGRQVLKSVEQATENKLLSNAIHFSTDINQFVYELQKERGRVGVFLGSKGQRFGQEMREQRAVTDKLHQAFTNALGTFQSQQYKVHLQDALKDAVEDTRKLAEIRRRIDQLDIEPSVAITYYTNLNQKMIDVIEQMAGHATSGDIASQINAYVYQLKNKEAAGIERAMLSSTFAKDQFTKELYFKFVENITRQKLYLEQFQNLASLNMKQSYDAASGQSVFAQVEKFRQIALDKSETGGFNVDAGVWFDTVTSKIDQLKKVEDQVGNIIVKVADDTENQARNAMWSNVLLTVFFVVLTTFIGVWSYRSISRPISKMTARMQDIAEGQGDLTQRVDATRKDELGVMAGYFNLFVEKIQKTVQHVTEATGEVASAATQIAATSEQMSTSLSQQKTQNSQVAAAVEELASSVSEIASRASKLSSHADISGQTAQEGNQVVSNTVNQIQQIARIVNEASSQMQELGERSKAIGMVINVINDIADQTNLLALNAAIEAARAGQHGRGFAVVADEVRKLAERTTTATDEVAQLITAIQTQTNSAIDHMGQGTAIVDQGVKAATLAGDALSRIVVDTKEVGSLVVSIAAATEEQSSATEQIAQSVEMINHASDQSSEAAGQAASAAVQLSQRAESLQSLIRQFIV